MSQEPCWRYFRAIYPRYRQADRKLKQEILIEFRRLNAGYHCKYANRLLNGFSPERNRPATRHQSACRYGVQALSVLAESWEAAGSPWLVRRRLTARASASRFELLPH